MESMIEKQQSEEQSNTELPLNILIVGGFNVNPERFLPLINKHNVYGISESSPKWSTSVKAGGPYYEIPEIKIKDIERYNIDIVWSLLSPWDGIVTTKKIHTLYPDLPIIRQTQGAATPWWYTENANKKPGNYKIEDLCTVLEQSSGLMFNAEKYRQALIAQGAKIDHIPYIITNGMAANADLVAMI